MIVGHLPSTPECFSWSRARCGVCAVCVVGVFHSFCLVCHFASDLCCVRKALPHAVCCRCVKDNNRDLLPSTAHPESCSNRRTRHVCVALHIYPEATGFAEYFVSLLVSANQTVRGI